MERRLFEVDHDTGGLPVAAWLVDHLDHPCLQPRPNPYHFAGKDAAIWQFPAIALPITIWRIGTAFSFVNCEDVGSDLGFPL